MRTVAGAFNAFILASAPAVGEGGVLRRGWTVSSSSLRRGRRRRSAGAAAVAVHEAVTRGGPRRDSGRLRLGWGSGGCDALWWSWLADLELVQTAGRAVGFEVRGTRLWLWTSQGLAVDKDKGALSITEGGWDCRRR
ncbi:hypothetical protein B0T26DRAFT_457226 [Lasiosphaeria miniovina]|uniref:Uncharacterized protein n=1 Tax=Lasiosphaeria miniovina TaxID=1954250 RepID=A0AA39ZZX5_9PEZI|nr:uncharacterized protein B0T26DRAFT_457226 [Lasiosphaeria miniovina]KAK0706494.1 hypothetical protein B0T26DRAFT_457226 [Lasiosphaeria miniovina]